ncbi:hypothetical protein pb186bvf_004703 [Paramecium bursaria]
MINYLFNLAQKLEKENLQAISITYQLASCLLFSFNLITFKLIKHIPPPEILFLASLLPYLMITAYLKYYDHQTYPPQFMVKLICRGLFGAISAAQMNECAKYLTSSETSILIKLTPFFIAIISIYYLKIDKLTIQLVSSILICFTGVLLILRPPFVLQLLGFDAEIHITEYRSYGVIMGLCSSSLASIAYSILSSLRKANLNQFVILQYFFFFCMFIPVLHLIIVNDYKIAVPSFLEGTLIILNGLFLLSGQILMSRSYIIGDLNQMSLFSQSQVLFNLIFDITLLSQQINVLSLVGTALVILAFTYKKMILIIRIYDQFSINYLAFIYKYIDYKQFIFQIKIFMKLYEKYEKNHIQAFSIIYQILACLFFSIAYLLIKVVKGISAGKVIYIGSMIPIVLVFMFCKFYKIAVYHKDKQTLLFARGIFSSLGQVCINISLQYIPTSETVILSRLNLIWIAFISIYYFKTEKLSLSLIIIIGLCLIGVALILRPPFIFNYFGYYHAFQYKDKNFGVIMAILFSLTSSVAFSTLTALKGSGVHQFAIIIILFSSIYDIYHPSKHECSYYEYIIIISNGLCMLIGQFFMNRSYLLGQLNQITLFSQSQILLNYIFDITILNQDIHILSIIGMLIVSGCFTFNILYK